MDGRKNRDSATEFLSAQRRRHAEINERWKGWSKVTKLEGAGQTIRQYLYGYAHLFCLIFGPMKKGKQGLNLSVGEAARVSASSQI